MIRKSSLKVECQQAVEHRREEDNTGKGPRHTGILLLVLRLHSTLSFESRLEAERKKGKCSASASHQYLAPLATCSVKNSLPFIFLVCRIEITVLSQDYHKGKMDPPQLIAEAHILFFYDDF